MKATRACLLGVEMLTVVLVVATTSVGCSSNGSGPKTGSAGSVGSAGSTGAAGSVGSAGAAGTGAAGSGGSGGSGGSVGLTGAAGIGTAGTGAAGLTGAAGGAGATADAGADATNDAAVDAGPFTLMSSSLKVVDGGLVFPAAQSAPMNQSPELHWTSAPEGTQSFALSMYDVTLKNTHFVLWNIDKGLAMLPAGLPRGAMPTIPAGSSQMSAFGGTPGYEGPGGGNVDNYELVLWALKVDKLNVGTMTLNQIHATLLPAQSLGSAVLLAKGTRNGL